MTFSSAAIFIGFVF